MKVKIRVFYRRAPRKRKSQAGMQLTTVLFTTQIFSIMQNRPKRFPEDNGFAKNVLSKFVLPILINDLFISFAFVCKGEIHTRLMKLCEIIVSLIR